MKISIPYNTRTVIEDPEYVVHITIFGVLMEVEFNTNKKNQPSGVRPVLWMDKESVKQYLVNPGGQK